MIYGLISDIHGNLEALEVVLGELTDADGFLCLGDIVGYGADPGPCLTRIRELPNLICVAGNHDLAAVGSYDLSWFNPFARAAIEWTAAKLTDEHASYLRSLPSTAHVDSALLVHGSLPNEMDYITSPAEARLCFDAMPGDLAFVGHTHVAEYYETRRRSRFPQQVSLWSGGEIRIQDRTRYIINPGAIGQPRDGNPAASFGVWDVESGAIAVRRVSYDVEAAQAKMREARLPEYLLERLSVGR
ncbi:MAG: metallophosphoesterase family protein [Armatimonadetes bacterium]|nr:metallophosphoesterase family protein [Armatimonadota bacterium]